ALRTHVEDEFGGGRQRELRAVLAGHGGQDLLELGVGADGVALEEVDDALVPRQAPFGGGAVGGLLPQLLAGGDVAALQVGAGQGHHHAHALVGLRVLVRVQLAERVDALLDRGVRGGGEDPAGRVGGFHERDGQGVDEFAAGQGGVAGVAVDQEVGGFQRVEGPEGGPLGRE